MLRSSGKVPLSYNIERYTVMNEKNKLQSKHLLGMESSGIRTTCPKLGHSILAKRSKYYEETEKVQSVKL